MIVITGHGDQDLADEPMIHDAAYFINRPIRKKALDAALKATEFRLAKHSGEQK